MSDKKLIEENQIIEKIQEIEPKDIVLGHACSEPQKLLETVITNLPAQKEPIKIWSMIQLGAVDYLKRDDFIHHSWFLGKETRQAMDNGKVEFVPVPLYLLPQLIENHKPDLALLQMREDNNELSFGLSVDYNRAAYTHAKNVIIQLNNQMPFVNHTPPQKRDNISYFSYDEPLIQLLYSNNQEEINDAIAENILEIISSSKEITLQLGIGSIPDKLCKKLAKTDLNISLWSELLSNGIEILYKENMLNPSFKHTCSMLMGSHDFYQFLDENRFLWIDSVSETNKISNIGKQKNMISVNNALMVDFQGQIVSEAVGFRQISGVGGQFDFVIGSQQNPTGKSIIVLPSHNRKGKENIVESFPEGTPVTIPRFYSNYIVTENGWVNLRGKTLKERKKALQSLL